jgi:hypothetical protein
MFLLSGCSAKFHYNKAVAKGMRCETITDTITIQKIDSVIINGVKTYFVTKVDTILVRNNVYIPKTRYETKIEWRKVRDTIQLLRYKTKVEYKVEKKKSTAKTLKLLIGVISCVILIIGILIWILKK